MEALQYFFITLGRFRYHEGITWLTHKYIMHGLGWYFHEDHHQPGYPHVLKKMISFCDFCNSQYSIIYFGTVNGINYFFIGLGILL